MLGSRSRPTPAAPTPPRSSCGRLTASRPVACRFRRSTHHVANWIAERARAGQAYATLRTAIAAVSAGHVAMGMRFDTRAPAIETVMRGIGRVHARAQGQVEPIRGADVVEMLGALGTSAIDLRDGALIAMGYCSACAGPSSWHSIWASRAPATAF